MFALMIEAACWVAVLSPGLLVAVGITTLVNEYRENHSK